VPATVATVTADLTAAAYRLPQLLTALELNIVTNGNVNSVYIWN
jgi:hypothetical protein